MKYAIVQADGCSVIVWHLDSRWHASVPGFGASNYGSRACAALRDMTVRDALAMWRGNGCPPSSSVLWPLNWVEVSLDELLQSA